MRCFEVDETVKSGLRVVRFPKPRVPLRGRDKIHLDPKLTSFIKRIPWRCQGDLVLLTGVLSTRKGQLVISPEPPEWQDSQALVHVTTQTLNGTIAVTSNASVERQKQGRKAREWLPLPNDEVTPVLGHWPVDLGEGALSLELLLVMEAASSFRIIRTGDLQGASPEIVVHWSGDDLTISVPTEYRAMHGLEPLQVSA